jgi:hypothetical protein
MEKAHVEGSNVKACYHALTQICGIVGIRPKEKAGS